MVTTVPYILISFQFEYRITGYFSGNLILALLAVVLVTLKIINANKTFTMSMNFPESEPGVAKKASR